MSARSSNDPCSPSEIAQVLIRFSKGAFEGVLARQPRAVMRIAALLVKRFQERVGQPPVACSGMLDWGAIEAIADAGYRYASAEIPGWLRNRNEALEA